MLRIEPRLALINGVLLANRVLIFRFQLLTVYVLLVHNCGECRIELKLNNGGHLGTPQIIKSQSNFVTVVN
jgi:hypothetical protein